VVEGWSSTELQHTTTNANVTVNALSTPVAYSTDGGDIWSVSQTLTIILPMDEDSGVYTCSVSNGAGNDNRVSFQLVVQGKHPCSNVHNNFTNKQSISVF